MTRACEDTAGARITGGCWLHAGADRRITLSSIRAPRVGRRDEKSEPWAVESREALRSALIGEPLLCVHVWRCMCMCPSKQQALSRISTLHGSDQRPRRTGLSLPRAWAAGQTSSSSLIDQDCLLPLCGPGAHCGDPMQMQLTRPPCIAAGRAGCMSRGLLSQHAPVSSAAGSKSLHLRRLSGCTGLDVARPSSEHTRISALDPCHARKMGHTKDLTLGC